MINYILYFIILLLLFIIVIDIFKLKCGNIILFDPPVTTENKNIIEKFNQKVINTFEMATKSCFDIKKKNLYIKYKNRFVSGCGSDIIFDIENPLDNKKYTIFRYSDFGNEVFRHSKQNFDEYFNFLRNRAIRSDRNYIFDFVGYHGIIDDKVRMWIRLKDYYDRKTADTIMAKTYLIPNDYNLFLKEYDKNKKYVLKNSFGGARSALKITTKKNEILNQFEMNRLKKYNPIYCDDAVCHSKVKYNILQEYIEPSFFIKGHKFGFRMFLVLMDYKNIKKALLWKDAISYYSNKEYINDTNMDYSVVGSILKESMQQQIKNKNLPVTYVEFQNYCKENVDNYQSKINNFETKLKDYFSKIIESNSDELFSFSDYEDIIKFSIFGFDVEFDKDFNPFIFEGNFYYTRFSGHDSDSKYKNLHIRLYQDIYTEMGLTDKFNYGFIKIK